MRRSTSIALALTLACGFGQSALSQETIVRGTVREGVNKPARNVQVGSFWCFDDGAPRPLPGVLTDRRGRFSITKEFYGDPVGVLALDLEAKRGGVVVAERDLQSLELVMRPATRVHGLIRSRELGYTPEWTNVYVRVRYNGKPVRIARCASDDAEFSFLLPEGEYELSMYGTDIQKRNETYLVRGEQMDLGTVDLAPTKLARLYGEPAPELTISEARGVDATLSIGDLRGKYVVLEFWGYW